MCARTHKHTQKYVRWTSLPRTMELPCTAGTLVTNYPLTLHDIRWDWRPQKDTNISQTLSYSQHSCQLVEKQNVIFHCRVSHLWTYLLSGSYWTIQVSAPFITFTRRSGSLHCPNERFYFSAFWYQIQWFEQTHLHHTQIHNQIRSQSLDESTKQLQEVTNSFVMSSLLCLPIRQICNRVTPTRQIFMKVYMWSFS